MTTLDRIRNLAAKQFGGDPQAMDADVPLEQLGADSLGYLEFLFELEDEFGVIIDQDEAKQIRTLRDLGAFMDRLTEVKTSQEG
jgi:acyl carrier protein